MTRPNSPRPLGTHGVPNLQLIIDYGTPHTRYHLQIHTQVMLKSATAAVDLMKLLSHGTRKPEPVLALLATEGEVTDLFHLERLVGAAMIPGPPATVRGTHGVPNLMVMFDFPDQAAPSWWFQVHTVVELMTRDNYKLAFDILESSGPRPSKAEALFRVLLDTGQVRDELHLMALLEAALAEEPR